MTRTESFPLVLKVTLFICALALALCAHDAAWALKGASAGTAQASPKAEESLAKGYVGEPPKQVGASEAKSTDGVKNVGTQDDSNGAPESGKKAHPADGMQESASDATVTKQESETVRKTGGGQQATSADTPGSSETNQSPDSPEPSDAENATDTGEKQTGTDQTTGEQAESSTGSKSGKSKAGKGNASKTNAGKSDTNKAKSGKNNADKTNANEAGESENSTGKTSANESSANEASTGEGSANKAGKGKSSAKDKPAPHVTFQSKVDSEWQPKKSDGAKTGSSRKGDKIEGIRIKLTGPVEGSVQYQLHSGVEGWCAVTANGKSTYVSNDDFIDALRIALTGKISKTYNVDYRVYVQGKGWLRWVGNGEFAGRINGGSPIQQLKVKLSKKQQTSAKGTGLIAIRYRANVQGEGWTPRRAAYGIAGSASNETRIRNFQLKLDTGTYTGSVSYRVHLTGGNWTGWAKDGASLGTQNNIDAIQIKLSGSIAKVYDIAYRTHVKDLGWQRRMRNGETGGWADSGLPIGAIRITLQKKEMRSGWIGSGGTWQFLEKGVAVKSTWLVTKESPIDTNFTKVRRYWIDANGQLAYERYIIPSTKRDKNAGFTAYADWSGNLITGKHYTDDGITLFDQNGKMYANNQWVTTDAFDGSLQRYRMVKRGGIAVVRTGLFKVNGKKYYAWEDERGYLMRSTTWWVANKWYKANSSGVLTNVNNKTTQHIERYVRWAISIANDDSHGYSQYDRWGPDYDCSSLVCSSLIAVGFPDSGALWTGNMLSCLTSIGFVWHDGTDGLRRGDIMLVHADYRQHTEIYIGNGKLVGAHISELGTIYGDPGDQTGREISVGNYYNAPWQGYLRYRG